MNLTDSKRDIFLIFNEPNSTPTLEEYDLLQSIVEAKIEEFELKKEGNLKQILLDAVELSDCECVGFGVQIIIKENK